MSRPRVVLVEDDLSLRRFVAMALEDLDIEWLSFASVEAGLSCLEQQPADLIITDLMLPGLSGFDLIRILAASPDLRGSAAVLVYSAGLSLAVRQQLQDQGIQHFLSKPCSIASLKASVLAALAKNPPDQPLKVVTVDASFASNSNATTLHSHFDGNWELYQAFRTSCLQQFEVDVVAGDLACQQTDSQALRRLAHSLKSILLMLDQVSSAELSRQLEQSADQDDWAAATPLWWSLRRSLQRLL